MPQYYKEQQRRLNGGSVRQARERAEALADGQMSERARPQDPRWATSIRDGGRQYTPGAATRPMRDDGRQYTPGAATRPMYSNAAVSRNIEQMHPPPVVWRTTPYSSVQDSPASSVEDLGATPGQQRGRGELAQDFRFPQVPKSSTALSRKQRGDQQQPPRQQTLAQSSPDSQAWPLPKPGRVQGTQMQPAPHRTAAAGTIPRPANPYDSESIYSRSSEPSTAPAPAEVVRQASQIKRVRPVLTTIRSPEMQESYASPTSPRANTINTLSAAIAAGLAPSSRPQTPQSQAKSSPLRMPFADNSPPRSPVHEELPLEPPRVFERSPTSSGASGQSHRPLLGSDPRPGMSDRIPSSRRPPRLNIEAVREAESRGSTTSLSELIRRATKLASNLDRGKTASRLGMLDMFNADEKGDMRKSGSISDMLSSFPEPGNTPTSTNMHDPRFPLGSSRLRNAEFAPHDSRTYETDKSNGRRCCGLSLTAFLIVLFILVILIAAAVLVPIFLIVVPRMQDSSTSLTHCSSSHTCQNMGISVISDDHCSCICTDGYTGDHCQLPLDAECTTTDVTIGGTNYDSATAGSSIPDILSGADKNFSIPLNRTALLSLFSANNLSCITENSVVNFNLQTQSQKRFIPIRQQYDNEPAPTSISSRKIRNARGPKSSAVASTNGIVFAATTTTSDSIPTSTASVGSSVSSAAPAASTSASPVSQKTLSFAQVVVLYVFQQTNTLTAAVNAQQTMQKYLANAGGDAHGILSVGSGTLLLSADFKNFEVLFGNGTSLGGVG